jgi:hypothetical protein
MGVYVTIEQEVEVELSEFDDEDIREEYNNRNLGGAEGWDEHVELERAHRHHHAGERELAYDVLWRMCLVKLNKIV